jgi:hypothetical protein
MSSTVMPMITITGSMQTAGSMQPRPIISAGISPIPGRKTPDTPGSVRNNSGNSQKKSKKSEGDVIPHRMCGWRKKINFS